MNNSDNINHNYCILLLYIWLYDGIAVVLSVYNIIIIDDENN